jgi:hypothetical protein
MYADSGKQAKACFFVWCEELAPMAHEDNALH